MCVLWFGAVTGLPTGWSSSLVGAVDPNVLGHLLNYEGLPERLSLFKVPSET